MPFSCLHSLVKMNQIKIKGAVMKKLFFLAVAIVTFIFSGTGEVKKINDDLKKNIHADKSSHAET